MKKRQRNDVLPARNDLKRQRHVHCNDRFDENYVDLNIQQQQQQQQRTHRNRKRSRRDANAAASSSLSLLSSHSHHKRQRDARFDSNNDRDDVHFDYNNGRRRNCDSDSIATSPATTTTTASAASESRRRFGQKRANCDDNEIRPNECMDVASHRKKQKSMRRAESIDGDRDLGRNGVSLLQEARATELASAVHIPEHMKSGRYNRVNAMLRHLHFLRVQKQEQDEF
jgi:hypothetical protein